MSRASFLITKTFQFLSQRIIRFHSECFGTVDNFSGFQSGDRSPHSKIKDPNTQLSLTGARCWLRW